MRRWTGIWPLCGVPLPPAAKRSPACGTDAAAWVREKTGGRCRIGPATLYTILAKFEQEKYIEEIAVEGRKRTYRITGKGRIAYREELERLRDKLLDE